MCVSRISIFIKFAIVDNDSYQQTIIVHYLVAKSVKNEYFERFSIKPGLEERRSRSRALSNMPYVRSWHREPINDCAWLWKTPSAEQWLWFSPSRTGDTITKPSLSETVAVLVQHCISLLRDTDEAVITILVEAQTLDHSIFKLLYELSHSGSVFPESCSGQSSLCISFA